MNCVKCGKPVEHSGHLCSYPPYTTNNVFSIDEAIWKLTQKMVLYEDMLTLLNCMYDDIECTWIGDIQPLLARAEKLK